MNSHNEARAAVTTAAIDLIEAMVRPDLVGDINERARIAAEVKRELDQMTPRNAARGAPNGRSTDARTRLADRAFQTRDFQRMFPTCNDKKQRSERAGSDDGSRPSRC